MVSGQDPGGGPGEHIGTGQGGAPGNDAPLGRADAPSSGQSPLGMALQRALAGYRRQMDEQLAAAGFAGRQFPAGRVLRMCAGPGATTISDVGRGLGITRQGASKIVAALREQGYLSVTPSTDDGREKILTLTPRAVDALLASYRAAGAIEKRVRAQIGDDAMEQFFRVLDVIADGEPGQPEDRSSSRRAARLMRLLLEERGDESTGPGSESRT
jgi:DNA-binding MarR family transcriptional regulator